VALLKFRLDREHCFEHDPAGPDIGRAATASCISTCTTAIAIRAHAPPFTTWLDAGAAKSGKCQRSSAVWTPSPAQLVEVIDPLQEMTEMRSKFLAHSGR
jgi:hypothetical protein